MRESRKWRGRWYLQKWPSSRAMASISAKVREHTALHLSSLPLEDVVGHLNSVLRGWGTYFSVGNSTVKFHTVDSYVHLRMAELASKKYGLHGRNWVTRFTYGWLTNLGSVGRCAIGLRKPEVNDVGEPDEWRTSCPESIGGGWQSRGFLGQRSEKPSGQRSGPGNQLTPSQPPTSPPWKSCGVSARAASSASLILTPFGYQFES